MPAAREYRHQPADSRRRGLPAIGFSLQIPPGLTMTTTAPIAPDRGTLLTCTELDARGEPVGVLEIGAFSAALIMDRDGILEQVVAVEAERALAPPAAGRRESVLSIAFDGGASGYGAEVVLLRDANGEAKPRLPYLAFYALGTDDIVDAGLIVSVRCAQPEWLAQTELLSSLHIVRHGGAWAQPRPAAAPVDDEMPHLPLLGRRRF